MEYLKSVVTFIQRPKIHQKFILIYNRLVWYKSITLLRQLFGRKHHVAWIKRVSNRISIIDEFLNNHREVQVKGRKKAIFSGYSGKEMSITYY